MMEYYELKVTFPEIVEDENVGVLVSDLADLGFDAFQQEEDVLNAYISQTLLNENRPAIDVYIRKMEGDLLKCELTKVRNVDWNEVWESNFQPIRVGDLCCVRAPFHKPGNCKYDIVIMPRMAFGTGHHATTYLMIENMFGMQLAGKNGLDMGCGTGILAILAVKLGATFMNAVDIDEWAVANCVENARTNSVEERISVSQGDASLLHGTHYDFILANINRNVLLQDMQQYAEHLEPGGEILFSGFLEPDVDAVVGKAASLGLVKVDHRSRDGWQAVRVRKS